MNDLAVKDVVFNGATLRAARDGSGVIYVGVRWVCSGIGFTEGQMKSERKRIRDDLVLSKGGRLLVLPTDGGAQKTLCMELDFLPLWLAKISITPRMQKVQPEIAEKLLDYQLHAKDALAEAFIKKEVRKYPHIEMPFDAQLTEIEEKINQLYSDMERFSAVMQNAKNHLDPDGVSEALLEFSDKAVSKCVEDQKNIQTLSAISAEGTAWKKQMYDILGLLVSAKAEFKTEHDVIYYICEYMEKEFGISWDGEISDYKKRYKTKRPPQRLNVIFENPVNREIFETELKAMAKNTGVLSSGKLATPDEIIMPLAVKYEDNSMNGGFTYKQIYDRMADAHGINWERMIEINTLDSVPTKKHLVTTNPYLRRVFIQTVDELLS